LLNRFDVAIRNGLETDSETDRAIKVLKDVAEFNKKNPMLMIEDEDIIRSLETRMKRRGQSYQGLSVREELIPYIYPLVQGTRSP
jgi:hypothetical protein